MPLVFVHGVAHRNTDESRADDAQRTALFERLVLSQGAKVFDPDWGSQAVKFDPTMPWLPPNRSEAFSAALESFGNDEPDLAAGDLGTLAEDDPALAIDIAFEAALAARAAQAVAVGQPDEANDEDLIALFAAAAEYVESDSFDPAVFAGVNSVAGLIGVLETELERSPSDEAEVEAMGVAADALRWVRRGLGALAGAARNAAATPLLKIGRAPLSLGLAYFLGDIFVYLQERGSQGWRNRIFSPIIEALAEAAKLQTDQDRLIVVAHSLGGVIVYDLLTDAGAVAEIEAKAGKPLKIDAMVTVGSQPSFFADLGLYAGRQRNAEGKFPCPSPVQAWMNVFDDTDVLSFACAKLFTGVSDYQHDNVTGLLDAHTAYFRRPSFYERLRKRLEALP